jgi:hypothetical protein
MPGVLTLLKVPVEFGSNLEKVKIKLVTLKRIFRIINYLISDPL